MIEKMLKQVPVISKTTKTKYLSERTMKLLEDRKIVMTGHEKKEQLAKIAEISKRIRESMRRDRKVKRLERLEYHIIKSGGVRKALKELRESGKEWISKVEKNNKKLTQRKEIHKVATNFYSELYSSNDSPRQESGREVTTVNPEPEFLTCEIEKAINSLKTDKAPGPDKICNELLKGTMEEVVPVLTSVFNEILITGVVPNQWGESHIILIHKKGAKEDIGNYRPISLMSNVYKVSAKVILGRIEDILDENH